MEWGLHPKNLLTSYTLDGGKCPLSRYIEVILIIDLLAEKDVEEVVLVKVCRLNAPMLKGYSL